MIVLGVLFLAFHLPYLPKSLEDLDSINFALGVRHFDVAEHQPHPPGYPVFIALAKAARAAVPDEARALALVSVAAGALGVVAIGALFRRLDPAAGPWWTLAGTALAIATPLYWFSAARPLSDMTGLAAAVAVQALTLGARVPLPAAAFCAGLAAGIRSQVAWLTLPLLLARGWGLGDWGTAGLRTAVPPRVGADPRVRPGADTRVGPYIRTAAALAAFAAGAALWFVPLVVITGGPVAYWRALSNQGAEDFGNISMLWTTHNLRAVEDALYYAFVAPWAIAAMAWLMLALAAVGILSMARRNLPALALLAAAFGPYLVFDLLFQETFTGRYALPLVVPMGFLAVRALRLLPRGSGLFVALAVSMFGAHLGGRSVAAFAREKAPAFRMLDEMASAPASAMGAPVLAMDRRNAFDFRRPIVWIGGAMPRVDRQLAAPPQHEWLEAVGYWNGGGRGPVWFVVDPKRTAIDLVQHGDPIRYRWPLPYPDLVSGARPNEMDWYRVERPEWYVGEGWSLTPEAAGVADADRRGLAYGPIRAWMSGIADRMLIGGRNFETHPVRLNVAVSYGFPYVPGSGADWILMNNLDVPPGAFLQVLKVAIPLPTDHPEYVTVDVTASPPSRVAVEQFDASASRTLVGFGAGWHEPEFNPRTGARWRWLSERGELRLLGSSPNSTLHVEGESPRTYFSRGSRLVIRAGDGVLFDRVVNDDFSLDLPIAGRPDTIVFETDQTYMPAERSRRTQDRRRLGLRIFRCEVR